MKNVLWVLGLLLFPFIIQAGGPPPDQHWVCTQPGVIDETHVYVVHNPPFKAPPNNYDVKEEQFEKDVQALTDGAFLTAYGAVCRDFTTLERAEKYIKKMVNKAKKRQFEILWISLTESDD